MNSTKFAFAIDEVVRGPVAVAVSTPNGIVVVLNYRVFNTQVLNTRLDILSFVLERIFRCVYSHYLQTIITVLGVEFIQMRCSPLAVNARVGPEINECDFSAQVGESWLILGVEVTRAAR